MGWITGIIMGLVVVVIVARANARHKRWKEKNRRIRDTAAFLERNRHKDRWEAWGLSPMQYPVHGAGFGNDGITEE